MLEAPKRRRRGRPRRDAEDQSVVDMAAALTMVLQLGRQQARDLALALLEGREATPTKTPRGARRAAAYSQVLGYELSKSFEGRAETIRGKRLKPRADVVAAHVAILRALLPRRASAQLKRGK